MEKAKKYLYPALIALVICGGVFVRFWQLNVIPPGVHYDEAYNGLDALHANETGEYKIFYSDNTGREGLHINVIAFFISIFGNSNIGLRFANAMWGSLTILGFYFLLRELKFSKTSVLLGTFIMATSFWHLVFSRTSYRAIMVPLILVWAFYFFWKGLNSLQKEKKDNKAEYLIYLWFIVSGLFLGLGFHTYIAFRVAPLIFLTVGISFIFTRENFLKDNLKIILGFLLATIMVSAPLIWYFSENFNELIFRSGSVSVFSAPGMNFLEAFWKSLSGHLSAFFMFGDHNPRHNYNDQPLLPHIWAVLFALGFLISFWEIVKKLCHSRVVGNLVSKFKLTSLDPRLRGDDKAEEGYYVDRYFHISVLAQSMFWVMLLPGVLSAEGIPHSLRIIETIPAVFLMIVLAVEYFLELKDEKIKLVIFGIFSLVILGGFSQVYLYFSKWAIDTRTEGAYERKLYNLGLLLKDLPVKKKNYVVTALNTTVSADHKQSSLKSAEYVGYPNSKNYLFFKPLEKKEEISCDDPQIVFLESDQWLRDQYRGLCPRLAARRYSFDNGKYLFWVVSRE